MPGEPEFEEGPGAEQTVDNGVAIPRSEERICKKHSVKVAGTDPQRAKLNASDSKSCRPSKHYYRREGTSNLQTISVFRIIGILSRSLETSPNANPHNSTHHPA
jgi:hypothetical protein